MRHAVIMAGGVGTRLWPLSRSATPKQFQRLIGDKTLLQQTYDRIARVIPKENIWVMTGEQHRQLASEQLPDVDSSRIITEPVGRNTAPATLLVTLKVLSQDPEATLFGLLPADHYIGKEKTFVDATEALLSFIEKQPEYVATIGIRPSEPNTGFGYIKLGGKIASEKKRTIFAVESFHEKPNEATATEFVESGEYLWNGGYYLFNGQQMTKYYQRFAPKIIEAVERYIKTNEAGEYEQIAPEPIDKAISEQLEKLAVVAAEMEWSDIGNWAALHEILASEGKKSQVVVGDHLGENTVNSLIMGGSKLIATVGLDDVVVIDTDDVILVCHKGSVQDVKKIVEQLQKQGREEYL